MLKGNNILIEYQMLYNVDLALLRLVRDKYNNPSYINNIVNRIPDKRLIYRILDSDNENPLSIVFRQQYEDNLDSFREQFFEQEMDYIVANSDPTDLIRLVEMYIKSKLIVINVLCKNQQEEQNIKKNTILHNTNVIVESDLSKLDISQYDSIFIRDYKDVLKFKGLEGKSLFIGNYNFNLEDDFKTPLVDVSASILDSNTVYIIDTHKRSVNDNIKG